MKLSLYSGRNGDLRKNYNSHAIQEAQWHTCPSHWHVTVILSCWGGGLLKPHIYGRGYRGGEKAGERPIRASMEDRAVHWTQTWVPSRHTSVHPQMTSSHLASSLQSVWHPLPPNIPAFPRPRKLPATYGLNHLGHIPHPEKNVFCSLESGRKFMPWEPWPVGRWLACNWLETALYIVRTGFTLVKAAMMKRGLMKTLFLRQGQELLLAGQTLPLERRPASLIGHRPLSDVSPHGQTVWHPRETRRTRSLQGSAENLDGLSPITIYVEVC